MSDEVAGSNKGATKSLVRIMLYCFDGLRVKVHRHRLLGNLDLQLIQVLWDRSLRVVCGRGMGPAEFPQPTCQQ